MIELFFLLIVLYVLYHTEIIMEYKSVKRNSKGKLIYTYSRDKNLEYRRGSYISHKVQQAKRNAKNKNLEFSIDTKFMKELLAKQNNQCAYSGYELGKIGDGYLSPSIDRIDNSLGYIPGNVQWLSWRVNEMKKDMLPNEFIELCKRITERATTNSTMQTIGIGSGGLAETQ